MIIMFRSVGGPPPPAARRPVPQRTARAGTDSDPAWVTPDA